MPSAAHSASDAQAWTIRVPHVSFTVSVNGSTVSVDCSASYGTSTPIVLSSWNFGDGTTATGVTTSHTYSTNGVYTITYTATQQDGAQASTVNVCTIGATGTEAPILAIGDSLTYGQDGGGVTWPGTLASQLGISVINAAATPSSAAGWTSVDAAIRMGALDPSLSSGITLQAGSRAAVSAPMSLTGQRQSIGSQTYSGVLGGVSGVLAHVSGGSGTYTFTPSSAPGSTITIPSGTTFHCTDFDSYVGQGYDMVIMLGRNDINYSGFLTTIPNSIDAILSRFNPAHYLVMGTIADPDSIYPNDKTNNVGPLDSTLQSHYGSSHFMSAQDYLASTAALTAVGKTPTSTDSSQIAAGDVPDTLSAVPSNGISPTDRPHLIGIGYESLGIAIANQIQSLGWVPSSAGTQPTGSGIVRYQDLAGATFDARWNAAGSNYLSLGTGTFAFSDFNANSSNFGADSGTSTGILGSGVAYTTIQMNANTSTKASTADSGSTNPYYLLDLNHVNGGKFDGFLLQGTSQGHDYNGLRSDYASGVTFSNLKISAVPGSSPSPPGETFYINVYGSSSNPFTNPVFDTIEFDGQWAAASTGATNGGVTDSTSALNGTLTYNRVYAHELKYGKAYAGWQTFGGGTFTECFCVNTAFGYGFEECGGTFTFNNCTFGGNITDLHLGNSHAARTKIVINDPILLAGQTKIKAYIPPTYAGNGGGAGNAQSASDITIYVGGVDKTSTMLQVITTWVWGTGGAYNATPITYSPPSWLPW